MKQRNSIKVLILLSEFTGTHQVGSTSVLLAPKNANRTHTRFNHAAKRSQDDIGTFKVAALQLCLCRQNTLLAQMLIASDVLCLN